MNGLSCVIQIEQMKGSLFGMAFKNCLKILDYLPASNDQRLSLI